MAVHVRLTPVFVIGLIVAQQVESRTQAEHIKRCSAVAGPPLTGESTLKHTSLPGVYDEKDFRCSWDVPGGVYWWSAPFRSVNAPNPIYGTNSKNATAEVGQGWWLTPVEYNITGRDWSSRSFVATRVAMLNHTICCCQFMQSVSIKEEYRLTEWCRAMVPGLEKSPSDSCAPFSAACPTDNVTASLQDWPLPPYSETYSDCMQPLGHTLERPFIRPSGRDSSAPKWAVETIATMRSEVGGGAFLFALTGMSVVSVMLVWRWRSPPMRTSEPCQVHTEDLLYVQLM